MIADPAAERFFALSLDLLCVAGLDGYFRRVNPAFEAVLGHAVAELLGTPVIEFVHPDDRAETRARLATLATGAPMASFRHRFRCRDGSYTWLSWRLSAPDEQGLVYGVARDVTELCRVETELRESEERHRLLFERNPLPMWTFDGETLRILAVNDAAVAHYGYSREEFLGLTLEALLPERDAATLQQWRAASGSGRNHIGPHRHRRKDGTLMMVEVVSDDAPITGGRARLALAHDVTERERAQAALRSAEDRLRHANKMEAVGRLIGGVAHDFNNQLTAIQCYGKFLLDDLEPTDPRSADAQEIMKAADRAAAVAQRLLAFSRKHVPQPVELDLNAVITGMEKTLRGLLGEDVRVVTELDAELYAVEADPGQVEQVILNLAVNARHAMPDGGTLTIHTRNETLERTDAPWAVRPGSYVLLSVSDTGVGMDAATRERLFEPFFASKGQPRGTGLAMVYGIVKQWGGHIWAESEPGGGATFRVYLPQLAHPAQTGREAAAPARARPRAAHRTGQTPGARETILLVDDEEAVRATARRAFQRAGYVVLPTGDGADALRMFAEHTGPVHLVVTDIVMPGLGGPELVRLLRQFRPDLPALYVSGYSHEGVRRQALLEPGASYLEKPFTPEKLLAKVREVLDSTAGVSAPFTQSPPSHPARQRS